jgi:hypothetical protein
MDVTTIFETQVHFYQTPKLDNAEDTSLPSSYSSLENLKSHEMAQIFAFLIGFIFQ